MVSSHTSQGARVTHRLVIHSQKPLHFLLNLGCLNVLFLQCLSESSFPAVLQRWRNPVWVEELAVHLVGVLLLLGRATDLLLVIELVSFLADQNRVATITTNQPTWQTSIWHISAVLYNVLLSIVLWDSTMVGRSTRREVKFQASNWTWPLRRY